MGKVIKWHLCSTETAQKVAESEACAIYQNRAGFYFAFSPVQQDISLLTDEQAQAELRKMSSAQAESRGIKTLSVSNANTSEQPSQSMVGKWSKITYCQKENRSLVNAEVETGTGSEGGDGICC